MPSDSKKPPETGVTHQQDPLALNRIALVSEIVDSKKTSEALRHLHITCTLTDPKQVLEKCVSDIALLYGTKYAFFGTFSPNLQHGIKTEIFMVDGKIQPNFEYELTGTPCEDVLNRTVEHIECNVAYRYPHDAILREQSIESYFAAPLVTPSGQTIGIVAVLDTHPLPLQSWSYPLMELYAARIAVELERHQRDAERALSEKVFQTSLQAIAVRDKAGKVIRVNDTFEKLTGYAAPSIIGKHFYALLPESQQPEFLATIQAALLNHKDWQGEVWLAHKNGSLFPTWQAISSIYDEATQELTGYVSLFSDISARKKQEEELYRLAHYDSLTHLFNRAAFTQKLEEAITRSDQDGQPFALIFIDLDHFKRINDAAGHRTGDELLSVISKRLISHVHPQDIIARLGADEFVVLTRQYDTTDDLTFKGQNILRIISAPIRCKQLSLSVTGCIGICTYPADGQDISTLLNSADTAMHAAKMADKKSVRLYTPELELHRKAQWQMERDIRSGLSQNQFVLAYQPLVNTTSGAIEGFEALIRWQHPKNGLILPDTFIPIAEESGLIKPMGRWVLEQALAQLKDWRLRGFKHLRMAVNVSGKQFQDPQFAANVQSAIQKMQVDAQQLELEITESVMMADIAQAEHTLAALKAIGVRIAIDDFGTGFSSMTCLKSYPIDRLKIDRSFVENVTTSRQDQAIVKASLSLAKNLSLEVIAEGVENASQLQFLQGCGCDEFQGYYFGKPMSAQQAMAHLSTQNPLQGCQGA